MAHMDKAEQQAPLPQRIVKARKQRAKLINISGGRIAEVDLGEPGQDFPAPEELLKAAFADLESPHAQFFQPKKERPETLQQVRRPTALPWLASVQLSGPPSDPPRSPSPCDRYTAGRF